MFFWNSLAFSVIQRILVIWSLVPLPFLKPAWTQEVHVLLKPGLENFEHYFTSAWDECNCAVVGAFFSVSALWCPLATPTVLLGFLLPWAWGISSRLLQQSAAVAPYPGRGVSPHCLPSWPLTWDSSSRLSCIYAATAPWTWGWSSWPPPLTSDAR